MGNPFGMFEKDPQDLPGQGLARADNYDMNTAAQEYQALINTYLKNQGKILESEQLYEPEYVKLGLRNTNLSLFGDGETPGLMETSARANTYARQSNIDDLGAMGGEAMGAYRSINPELGKTYDSLLQSANQQLAMGSRISPEDTYRITSGVRSDFANRGLGNSNPAMLEEALQLFGGGEALRNSRQNFAMNAAGANQAYMSPVYSVLLGESNGAAQGANFQSTAGPTLLPAKSSAGLLAGVYGENQANNRATSQNETFLAGKYVDMMSSLMGGSMMCWAAREVFGAQDARWLLFRHWLLTEAPDKLREWYRANGEAWAARLRENPSAKVIVKRWMQRRVDQIINRKGN